MVLLALEVGLALQPASVRLQLGVRGAAHGLAALLRHELLRRHADRDVRAQHARVVHVRVVVHVVVLLDVDQVQQHDGDRLAAGLELVAALLEVALELVRVDAVLRARLVLVLEQVFLDLQPDQVCLEQLAVHDQVQRHLLALGLDPALVFLPLEVEQRRLLVHAGDPRDRELVVQLEAVFLVEGVFAEVHLVERRACAGQLEHHAHVERVERVGPEHQQDAEVALVVFDALVGLEDVRVRTVFALPLLDVQHERVDFVDVLVEVGPAAQRVVAAAAQRFHDFDQSLVLRRNVHLGVVVIVALLELVQPAQDHVLVRDDLARRGVKVLDQPDVVQERVVAGLDQPESGQQLAVELAVPASEHHLLDDGLLFLRVGLLVRVVLHAVAAVHVFEFDGLLALALVRVGMLFLMQQIRLRGVRVVDHVPLAVLLREQQFLACFLLPLLLQLLFDVVLLLAPPALLLEHGRVGVYWMVQFLVRNRVLVLVLVERVFGQDPVLELVVDGVRGVLVDDAGLLVLGLELEELPEFVVLLLVHQVAGVVVEEGFELLDRMYVHVGVFLQVSEVLVLFVDLGALDHAVELLEVDFVFDVFVVIVSVFVFVLRVSVLGAERLQLASAVDVVAAFLAAVVHFALLRVRPALRPVEPGVVLPVLGLAALLLLGGRAFVVHPREQFAALLLDAPLVVDEQGFGQAGRVLHAQLVGRVLLEPLLHLVAALAHLVQHLHGVLPVFVGRVLGQLLVDLVARQVVEHEPFVDLFVLLLELDGLLVPLADDVDLLLLGHVFVVVHAVDVLQGLPLLQLFLVEFVGHGHD